MERKSNLFAHLIEAVGIISRGTSQDGTNLHGAGQQHTGLQTYHLYILVLSHVVACLEVHVVLLSLTNLEGCLSKEVEHLRQMVRVTLHHSLIGQYQHGVAREDGCVGIPPFVHRLMSTAQVGLVHQVVV